MTDLERTELANLEFKGATEPRKLMDILTEFNEEWGGDDEVIVSTVDTENPESCESCQ